MADSTGSLHDQTAEKADPSGENFNQQKEAAAGVHIKEKRQERRSRPEIPTRFASEEKDLADKEIAARSIFQNGRILAASATGVTHPSDAFSTFRSFLGIAKDLLNGRVLCGSVLRPS